MQACRHSQGSAEPKATNRKRANLDQGEDQGPDGGEFSGKDGTGISTSRSTNKHARSDRKSALRKTVGHFRHSGLQQTSVRINDGDGGDDDVDMDPIVQFKDNHMHVNHDPACR